jgi:(4S)-4-hydroxy-5-phosphonooxypentane-2,3-dione isomerase
MNGDDQMIGLVAVIKIKPGMEEKVAYACLKMAEEVGKHEKECLLYEPFMPADGTAEVYILEKYTSEKALDEHRKTAHYQALKETLKDAVTEPIQATLLKPLG